MSPLVSVVIPVFNAERFLAKTLSSVQKQTYNNIEIIIVNDGSSDSSLEIAARYALSDPRIRVDSQKNKGVASARNFGLRCSSGEYIAFLDADDLWHPTKIERQMRVLLELTDSARPGAVYTLYRTIDTEDLVKNSSVKWSKAGAISTHLVTMPVGNGSSILTRREVAVAVGGFDSTYKDFDAGGCEDLDFELKIAARFPIAVVPEYLVGYRSYQGNMSSHTERMVRAMTAVVEKHLHLNPGLSRNCVDWTYGRLYRNCMFAYLGGHQQDLPRALHMMARLIFSDPPMAMTELCAWLAKGIAKRIFRKTYEMVRYRAKGPPGCPFYEVSPLKLGPLPRAILRRSRLAYLAREDNALLSAHLRTRS
jgi:glycosyltransferase involved in cell wall biosynthesis